MLKHMSSSSFDTFETCEKMFYYKYIEKIKEPEGSDALAVGNGVHAAMELWSKNPCISKDMFLHVYEHIAKKDKNFKTNKGIEKYFDMVEKIFDDNLRIEPYIHEGKPFVEPWFNWKLTDNCIIKGKIDILSNKLNVVDYKTSRYPFYIDEIKDTLLRRTKGKGRQLCVYYLAIKEVFNIQPNKTGFMVFSKQMDFVTQRLSLKPSEEVLNKVKLKLISIYNNIQNKLNSGAEFIAKPSTFNCRYCPGKTLCKYYTK